MPRTLVPRIPAHVTLRALREARELSVADFAAILAGHHGIKVVPDYISAIELGHEMPGRDLLFAWADELGIDPRAIRLAAQIRKTVADADEYDAAKASAKAA